LTSRTPIVRSRLAALIACSLIVTIVPISAVAEQGIAPGSGGVVTAGQPLLVRATPGWDAEVSYEIADGSYVTVWDVAQTAPDGTLWYPVDGGFVPVDAVTSLATLDGGVALYQEAPADEWVEPAASEGWVDPSTGEWVEPAAEEWVDPAATEYVETAAQEGWVDPNTGEWVEPATQAQESWVDPNTGEWVDPMAAETGWTDPNTGEWVEPTATETGWTDPNTGEWVEPAAAETGWVDPNTGEWVEPAAEAVAAPAEEWVEPAPAEAVATGGPEPWGEPIGTAYISGSSGDGAVCRVSAQRGSNRLAVLAEGEAVEVRGEAVGEWQPVNCAGVGGYVHTSLIAWEPAAPLAAEEGGRRGRNRGANAGNDGAATSTGNQIADFAMQYVGYPYVYAGEGPYAFDCSGFTKFVIQNTLGMDITHDMFQQIEMGQAVGRGELRPGDLVFFANTFRPGLSHAGIYIGGGQFVNAQNEQTGVVVSDLNSDYYGSRWAGATRIG
jgi:cell wall-associated NlpC family hydrolase